MKATFKKIGPIKDAELELGDLTIIAGQNNTGKTYLVYVLYGFLLSVDYARRYLLETEINRDFSVSVHQISKDLKENGNASIEFLEYKKLENILLRKISSIFSSHHLGQVFSTRNGAFKYAKFRMESMQDVLVNEKNGEISYGEKRNASIKYNINSSCMTFEISNQENIKTSLSIIKKIVNLSFMNVTFDFIQPFILSAERFGISLFYKELDFTKNRLVEELQKLSDEKHFNPFRFLERQSARYAQPIKDNIDFTRDLSTISKKNSELMSGKLKSVEKLMDGYYKATREDINFISKRRGENRFSIPLHLASSSARGISDLYFYLKHVAKLGQLLIIDEPESHLSPTNQILMARLLVFCVNSGLKVLITTHSDYLIKEINNLIMLHGDFQKKADFLKRKKKEYTENDNLNPEMVKAYICENGGLKPCDTDYMGIAMPVFDDAIDRINQVSNELFWLKTEDNQNDN